MWDIYIYFHKLNALYQSGPELSSPGRPWGVDNILSRIEIVIWYILVILSCSSPFPSTCSVSSLTMTSHTKACSWELKYFLQSLQGGSLAYQVWKLSVKLLTVVHLRLNKRLVILLSNFLFRRYGWGFFFHHTLCFALLCELTFFLVTGWKIHSTHFMFFFYMIWDQLLWLHFHQLPFQS